MPKSLGIYIEDDVIKYSKVDKTKDIIKVDASGVEFYEKDKLYSSIEKIIRETFSAKDPICINISNELYNYFDVFSALKTTDRKKSVELDFELLCGEKGYNKDSLDARFIFTSNRENSEKLKAFHVATNKENLRKRVQDFSGYKVVSATPITTSVLNLLDEEDKNGNVVIVNMEKDTKVTTILSGEIYNVTIIPEGMGEILNNINATENSLQKSYECCKNTTIYTQDSQELQTIDDNEHLEDVMPTLYKIVTETKKIVDSAITQISKVYITGIGTIINNLDLYFQEYIPNSKCELLKPFFMETASIKIPIKEYIEINSATALALEALGYGDKELNFKAKVGGGDFSFDGKSIERTLKNMLDWKNPLTAIDKTLLRVLACVCVGIIGYIGFSSYTMDQIEQKEQEVSEATATVTQQISLISVDRTQIAAGTSTYQALITALTATDEEDDTSSSSTTDTSTTVISKDAIPNLLNRIVYVIPDQVQITSIKNSESDHIVIQAQAGKYEQLGYFKAVLSTENILLNVKSSSGTKSGDVVTITIEGDLP